MDAAGRYVAGYAEVTDVGFVAHALEFADGDVVALVVAAAAEGEVGDGAEDDHGGDNEFDGAFAGFVWHMRFRLRLQFTSVQVYVCCCDLGIGAWVWVPPPVLVLRKVSQ